MTESKNEFLYGIFHHIKNQSKFIHIGNIKIGPIKPEHNSTEIGYIIGNKSYWGKGVMTESIRLATLICKNKYNLSKINAGVYENNIGSIRALKKKNVSSALKETGPYIYIYVIIVMSPTGPYTPKL